MTSSKTVAVVGAGVIGGGWVARFLENGFDVALYDPAADTQSKVEDLLINAEHAYSKLTMAPRNHRGALTYAKTLALAVAGAELVMEAVPENLTLKQQVYRDIEQHADEGAIIASSTSGILPTQLQAAMRHPERLIVTHPFNPVYLLPLVEVVGGELTAAETIDSAMGLFRAMGMHPLHIKKEIEAFVADRFLEAVWREALWIVDDGIATTAEIDDAIRYGFGLRWAQMGLFETYRLAGGEAGMRHFIAQFGPCLAWPWTKLMDVPELTEELIDTIAAQSDAQSGQYSFRELERIRDDNLVAILQALKVNDWGAGQTLGRYEQTLFDAGAHRNDGAEPTDEPLLTVERTVPPDWTDYNNHMNESRYLQCFADASDALLRRVGVDANYLANSGSYFTVETHIRHLDEVAALQPIKATTQVLSAAGKKLHVFHRLFHGDGRLLATAEQLLLHVNLTTRSASEPTPGVLTALRAIADRHASLVVPEGCGRAIGDPR